MSPTNTAGYKRGATQHGNFWQALGKGRRLKARSSEGRPVDLCCQLAGKI
ncbi:MAG: hypothetical protein HC849_12430 [Oscillatoriales cyanobacterium RU_3_3]|nr:hypothetical protein [Oscillatoriales cyanobacterium RU_3_3]